MKFLIAGLGSIGRRHLRNLRLLGQDNIVLFRTHQSTLPDDDLAGFPVYTDLDEALGLKPDAVLITNPTSHHLKIAIPAANAGYSLFMEKPISDCVDQIPLLIDALERGGGFAIVGFQFRFHPGLKKVKSLLDNHAVGKVVSVRAHWGEYLPGWHPWEDYRKGYAARSDLGGGVVRTLCHPLDYLRWFFGEVLSVYAITKTGYLGIDVEEVAEISLQFMSGVTASVHLDYLQRPPSHKLEIIADQGSITWDFLSGDVNIYQAGEHSIWEEYTAPPGFERNQMFLDQMKHFLSVLNGTESPVCTLDDGYKTQKLIEAVYQSAAAGQPVTISTYDN